MACDRITAGITRQFAGRAPDQGAARSLQPDRLHQRTSASTRRGPTAGRRVPRRVPRQLGHPRQRLGGGVLPRGRSRIRRSAPTSRTTTSASKCRTATAPRRASTCPTSSCWWTTATAPTTCCTSSSRSRATGARMPRRRRSTMETYWVPGVNHLGTYGRWAFAEFTDVYQIEADFEAKVESEFNKMIDVCDAHHASRKELAMAKKTNAAKTVETLKHDEATSGRTSRPPSIQSVLEPRSSSPMQLRYRAQHATSTRSSSGAARTSRTGATSSSSAAALHPGEGPPQGADRRPAAPDQRSERRSRRATSSTSSPTSTASRRASTRPSSTSTTRTGRTA